MLLNYLNDTIFRLNMVLDKGGHASLDAAYQHIDTGDVFEWLSSDFGCDFSIILVDKMIAEKTELTEALRRQATARRGSERRKLGVENNGLCLIIGLVIDIISSEKISIEHYDNFYTSPPYQGEPDQRSH